MGIKGYPKELKTERVVKAILDYIEVCVMKEHHDGIIETMRNKIHPGNIETNGRNYLNDIETKYEILRSAVKGIPNIPQERSKLEDYIMNFAEDIFNKAEGITKT